MPGAPNKPPPMEASPPTPISPPTGDRDGALRPRPLPRGPAGAHGSRSGEVLGTPDLVKPLEHIGDARRRRPDAEKALDQFSVHSLRQTRWPTT